MGYISTWIILIPKSSCIYCRPDSPVNSNKMIEDEIGHFFYKDNIRVQMGDISSYGLLGSQIKNIDIFEKKIRMNRYADKKNMIKKIYGLNKFTFKPILSLTDLSYQRNMLLHIEEDFFVHTLKILLT